MKRCGVVLGNVACGLKESRFVLWGMDYGGLY